MIARGRLLFIFLDGVGIGDDDPERNPFLVARLPTLGDLFGGDLPTVQRPRVHGPDAVSFPVDAAMGVEGTPQSGTGQAALLTGRNAARLFGRHFGPWTPVALRPLVERENLLLRVQESGRVAAFANAYPRGWPGSKNGRRVAGPPLAARSAGLLDRHEEHLVEGRAVSSEIVNSGWRHHLGHDFVPDITASQAGANLASIANAADLTLYAHYTTDTAGHRGGMEGAVAALERVDRFVEGVLTGLDGDVTLLVTSDHGNVEEVGRGHTRNPALGICRGPGAGALADGIASLPDVAPSVLVHLGAPEKD